MGSNGSNTRTLFRLSPIRLQRCHRLERARYLALIFVKPICCHALSLFCRLTRRELFRAGRRCSNIAWHYFCGTQRSVLIAPSAHHFFRQRGSFSASAASVSVPFPTPVVVDHRVAQWTRERTKEHVAVDGVRLIRSERRRSCSDDAPAQRASCVHISSPRAFCNSGSNEHHDEECDKCVDGALPLRVRACDGFVVLDKREEGGREGERERESNVPQ